ncbi:MAG: ABC transporter ATP-binding protein [Clostridia bacterium]|nr:ABC transporter ATP-binding protein [Clostridia bacterium]
MQAIKTENLTKFYGKSRGIIDVSLSIDEGEFFGFIGPNGAGKSTLIRTLLGLIAPTSGRAEIFGRDIVTERTEILKSVGYMPSEAKFYSGMRVGEMLDLSAKLRGVDCAAEQKLLCERLELDTSRKIDELSLGNRKKVGIVTALQHNPALCILDEPTSGLDPLMQKEFYSILSERCKAGATVFLSSHILAEIARYCNRAAIIREGKILVTESVENLAHTGIKRVALRGISDLESFRAIDGIRDVTMADGAVKFLYSGEACAILSHLAKINPTDVSITDPELDEILISYYGREADK